MTAVWLALGPPAANALGVAAGWPLLLPLLGAAVAYPVFLDRVARGRPAAAFGWMLYWTVFQSLAVWILLAADPERGTAAVHRGAAYASEMLHWVRTGVGAESRPAQFLPVHAGHFAAFCLLAAATAGAAALALGTWLLNYMNVYVYEVTVQSVDTVRAALLAWHPWAVIRVVGYIATAVALAFPGLRWWRRLLGRPAPPSVDTRRFLFGGAGLVVLDALLKTALAPHWQRWLLGALEGR
jgi:hypothetical protein